MRQTPRALALRIDRLARHAHAFHRFAHHPLCDRYASELVTLGARHICRGCLTALLGFGVGSCVGICLVLQLRNELILGGVATLLGLSSIALRLPKTLARFLPAAMASAAFASAAHRFCTGDTSAAKVIVGGLALSAVGVINYRRRGPNRVACTNCPERINPSTCSGMAPIVRRERAFQRLSQRWLDARK